MGEVSALVFHSSEGTLASVSTHLPVPPLGLAHLFARLLLLGEGEKCEGRTDAASDARGQAPAVQGHQVTFFPLTNARHKRDKQCASPSGGTGASYTWNSRSEVNWPFVVRFRGRRVLSLRWKTSADTSPLMGVRQYGLLTARGRNATMTAKEKAVRAVQELPDDASIEDAMERLLFLAKIERGIQQADAGQTIPHERVRDRMAK